MSTNDLYELVTEKIVAKLEKAGSWKKLWDCPAPLNMNGRLYHGINWLLLSSDDFELPVYGTFNQIRQNGGQVNKGEKSTIVVYWDKFLPEPEDGKVQKPRFFLKFYHVFNVCQAHFDELGHEKINALAKVKEQNNLPLVEAEKIVAGMPDAPSIDAGKSDRAYYVPALDIIKVPDMKYFTSSDEYYATVFHEMVHSTGHAKRLDRFKDGDPDDSRKEKYSKEELVAEMGASYLSAVARLNHDIDNSAAYIKGWASHLKDNPQWIVWASKRAVDAANFILDVKDERAAV